MNTDYRNIKVKEKLSSMFKYLALSDIVKAEQLYSDLLIILGEDDPHILTAQTEIDFLKNS